MSAVQYPPPKNPDSSSGLFRRIIPNDEEDFSLGVTRYLYLELPGFVALDNELGEVLVLSLERGYHPIRTNRVYVSGTSPALLDKIVGFW